MSTRLAIFSARSYDKELFTEHLKEHDFELHFFETSLTPKTAPLAAEFDAACLFVCDKANREVMELLKGTRLKYLLLRSAGFNHVDLSAAAAAGLRVARVPAYSPEAVAEHTVALLMTLNRKVHKAYNRSREGNFSLEGLKGFNIHGKTVGVVGTGQIGEAFCRIMAGFGAKLIAYDPYPREACKNFGVEYCSFKQLCEQSDIISLHCPLDEKTRYLINEESLSWMKPTVFLLNTGRGALMDTRAVIKALKSSQLSALAIDVYEEEDAVFFADHSGQILQDDVLARLLTFPNVLITGHQGFFTDEALSEIVRCTYSNLKQFIATGHCDNELKL